MIKVLHIVSELGGGGVESMLYNYYFHLERNKIHFDFIVHGDNKGVIEEKVEEMGSIVYHVTPKKISFKDNMSKIEDIIKNGDYDVVHCHQNFSNFFSLYLAWKHKVPVRISHAHGCKEVKSVAEKVKHGFLRLLNKCFSNYYFSCGLDAGKWLHGEAWTPNSKNILMNNAIDLTKFNFNQNIRDIYRDKLGVKSKKILLHVGRFSDEKNQVFLVRVMKKLIQNNKDYILFFVGDGATKDSIKDFVKAEGLQNNIQFLGLRNDIAELMSASDIFLLPSKNEGFPVTLVEAQATGIKVLVSNVITKETKLSDNIRFLPISSCSEWVEGIISTNYSNRISKLKEIEDAGFGARI